MEAVEAPVTKRGKSRKALKNLSPNEANISAGKIAASPVPAPAFGEVPAKEGLSLPLSPKMGRKSKTSKKKAAGATADASAAAEASNKSFADELLELQGRLEQLRIEKERTEEMLRQRDEVIKQKDEEIENRGKEKDKLQKELKKLQKVKEFKPTMVLSFSISFRIWIFKDASFSQVLILTRCSLFTFLGRAYLLSCL